MKVGVVVDVIVYFLGSGFGIGFWVVFTLQFEPVKEKEFRVPSPSYANLISLAHLAEFGSRFLLILNSSMIDVRIFNLFLLWNVATDRSSWR